MKVDRRHKDANWALPTDEFSGKVETWEAARLAVLMDIRDELKLLNSLLACRNFMGLPHTLARIDRRLAQRRPLKLPKGRVRP